MATRKKRITRKCIPLKNKWCQDIQEFAHFADPDSKGINVVQVRNLETGARGHGILYRFKFHELPTQAVWLSFCPFCGANVEERTKERK